MLRVCHSLFIVVLLSLGIATGVAVRGQTAQSNPTKIPWCSDFSRFPRLGRPTLQRRGQPAGNTSTVAEEQPEPIKCKGLEDGTVQNLVSVRFVGLRSFHELDVIELIEDAGVALRPDRMPDAETADKAAGALKKLLSTKGHVYAVVNAIRDEQFNSVTFQVIEGQRLPLADIRFEGTKVFSPDELKTFTRECLSRSEDSEVAYDEELLGYCLRNTANFIRSRGHLQAQLGEPQREIVGNHIVDGDFGSGAGGGGNSNDWY